MDVHLVYSLYSTSMSSSDRLGQGERKLPDCTHKQNLVNRERESNCLEEVLTSSIALIELMLQDDSNSYTVVIVIVCYSYYSYSSYSYSYILTYTYVPKRFLLFVGATLW